MLNYNPPASDLDFSAIRLPALDQNQPILSKQETANHLCMLNLASENWEGFLVL